LILVDEPTGSLDSHCGAEVLGLLASIASEGRAVLLATHDPQAAKFATRTVTIRDGHLGEPPALRAAI
jgi:ABC-type lipoprotein export system ATPase subunit